MGTEMVAITAGEAANPRKTVPKAIERVFYRSASFIGYCALDFVRNLLTIA
jgi:amino acid permease